MRNRRLQAQSISTQRSLAELFQKAFPSAMRAAEVRFASIHLDSPELELDDLKHLGGHFKTGHRGSLQNRPTEHHSGQTIITLPNRRFGEASSSGPAVWRSGWRPPFCRT